MIFTFSLRKKKRLRQWGATWKNVFVYKAQFSKRNTFVFKRKRFREKKERLPQRATTNKNVLL